MFVDIDFKIERNYKNTKYKGNTNYEKLISRLKRASHSALLGNSDAVTIRVSIGYTYTQVARALYYTYTSLDTNGMYNIFIRVHHIFTRV